MRFCSECNYPSNLPFLKRPSEAVESRVFKFCIYGFTKEIGDLGIGKEGAANQIDLRATSDFGKTPSLNGKESTEDTYTLRLTSKEVQPAAEINKYSIIGTHHANLSVCKCLKTAKNHANGCEVTLKKRQHLDREFRARKHAKVGTNRGNERVMTNSVFYSYLFALGVDFREIVDPKVSLAVEESYIINMNWMQVPFSHHDLRYL